MSNTVYTVEDVDLLDDTTVTLKPLSIKTLRIFMKKMSEFQNVEDEDSGLDLLLEAGAICLKNQRPEFWDEDLKDKAGSYTEALEEAMDMQTLYKVLEICGGVKLNDPNLIAAALAATE